MASNDPLRGACSCGRNHYLIILSDAPISTLQVMYDDAAEHSHGLSLRVPLTTIRSTTQSFYPDETHQSIRRVFTPRHAPSTKRHFCGFCGTPLSYWSEESPEEANFLRVNMGSLKSESVERLQDAGLLDGQEEGEKTPSEPTSKQATKDIITREIRGNPWFEGMLEGSKLGKIRRRKGEHTSADGSTTYEWEIVEIEGNDAEDTGVGTAKRKLGDVGDGEDDTEMRG